MSDQLARIEERRLALGLSQRAVADRLGITQPHYSKVVGGLVRLTPEMAEAMHGWMTAAPALPTAADGRTARIRALTRGIERQLRELNALVGEGGVGGGRRAPGPTRRKVRK